MTAENGQHAEPESPLLRIDDVTKRYRSIVAVRDVSVDLEAGEFVGLIGPNGAGKSTLMGCVAGTLAADDGSIRVGPVDVGADPVAARRRVAFISQELELYEYLTGQEFLEFVADLRGDGPDASGGRIDELLEMTELAEARDRLVREYSGGMRRKLAVASALLGPPELLLLDESFVGLDPESAYRIRSELETFRKNGGAILLSSHSLEMIREMCSRVLILVDGELARDLSSEELDEMTDSGGYENLTEIYLDVTGKTAAAG